ncbi:PREDICTED: progestin and adipoQ receptor family member 3-like isoform X2 [Priapulus caudatus]|nr:PREDICTED: progestin and adipoQ receptor family member 3-like isoform X2 [Priapulus caudatus]XP_014669216.1 PREDICTED: progestin and adipoQ receptor family member 3-like isoform X2 [Priapulus caudatus]XP_014669217.1 PREDICTED: progestin and adipoQ receptor family member 3-like isoform X2 [Priapulus caudatus]
MSAKLQYNWFKLDPEKSYHPKDNTGRMSNGIFLYSYKDIPEFLKGNPFVINGYRAFLPPSLIIRSLCFWSNESINIWSHLLGCLFFFLLMLYDVFVIVPHFGGPADILVMCLALLSYQVCTILSAVYHLVNCHSEAVAQRWLALDFTGISAALLGIYLPGTFYAYTCFQVWRDFYMGMFAFMVIAVMSMQLHSQFLSEKWRVRRLVMYALLAAYGVIPCLHWIYLNGGWQSSIVQVFIPKVITMYLVCGVAFGFYIFMIPERWLPGKLDYVGHSHQWWHIIMVFAMYWWHRTGLEFAAIMALHPCI